MKKIIIISTIGFFLIAGSSLLWLVLHKDTRSVSQQVTLPKDAEDRYKSFQNVVDETSGDYRLVVYRYGSPPLLLKRNTIKIDGFVLDVYRSGQNDPIFSEGGGEIDPQIIIDYSEFENGILRITSCVWDPRKPYEDNVPFVENRVQINITGKVNISRKILLQPEEASNELINKLFAEIIAKSDKAHNEEDIEDEAYEIINQNLAQLRNIALNNPDEILTRMKALPHLTGDCACEHLRSKYLEEVEMIQSVLRID